MVREGVTEKRKGLQGGAMGRKELPSSEAGTPGDPGESAAPTDVREGGGDTPAGGPGCQDTPHRQTPAAPQSQPTCLGHTPGGDQLSVGSGQLYKKGVRRVGVWEEPGRQGQGEAHAHSAGWDAHL